MSPSESKSPYPAWNPHPQAWVVEPSGLTIGFDTQNNAVGQVPAHLVPEAVGGNIAWHVFPMQAQSVMTQFIPVQVTAVGLQDTPDEQTP